MELTTINDYGVIRSAPDNCWRIASIKSFPGKLAEYLASLSQMDCSQRYRRTGGDGLRLAQDIRLP